MSEYTRVNIKLRDAISLKDSLKEMGYEFEEHKEPQHLYGYMGKKRQQKAHIIVRRKHISRSANDIGFLKNANGEYEMIISEYDRRAGKQAVDFMERLKQLYATHKIMRKVKSMGYIVGAHKNVDGNIQFVAKAR